MARPEIAIAAQETFRVHLDHCQWPMPVPKPVPRQTVGCRRQASRGITTPQPILPKRTFFEAYSFVFLDLYGFLKPLLVLSRRSASAQR